MHFQNIIKLTWSRRYVHIRPVLQFSATECGVAALAMLFSYYRLHVPWEELRERCGASRDGVKAVKLIEVAAYFGFEAEAYRVELKDIVALNQPVIAYWRFNHYVIIKWVGKEGVFINDPAQGAVVVSLSDFDKYFTGVIILLKPKANLVRTKPARVMRSLLRTWLANQALSLCFLVTCMLLVTMMPLMHAKLTSAFIDYVVIGNNDNCLPYFALIMMGQGLIGLIALYLQKITQFRLTAKAGVMKSVAIMLHIMKLPLLFFSLRQKPEIAAIMMRADVAANLFFETLSGAVASLVTAVAAFIFLLKIDSALAWPILLQLILLVLPIKFLMKRNAYYEQANVANVGKYYGLTLSSIKNIETIKTCGVEEAVLTKWVGALYDKISGLDKSNSTFLLFDMCLQIFYASSLLITLAIGSARIANGILSVGNLIGFYALQLCFISQIMIIFQAVKRSQNVFATESRMQDLLSYTIDRRFQPAERLVQKAQKSKAIISCSAVNFFYGNTEFPALSNITLDIFTKQHIAFVGNTGSGKSTLVKVLAHLYPPSSGCLLLEGQEYQQGGAAYFSKKLAYVSQEVSLFSGTIYDNLTLWQPGVSATAVEAAIKDACLTELIDKRGLQGKVEEGGRNLSGGERQRLEIARALIQQPTILVLDEATSALDVDTERKILAHLRARPLTILYVAHRLQTVQDCDCIYVMEKGCIVEQGTHTDLVARRSYYYHLLVSDKELACKQ